MTALQLLQAVRDAYLARGIPAEIEGAYLYLGEHAPVLVSGGKVLVREAYRFDGHKDNVALAEAVRTPNGKPEQVAEIVALIDERQAVRAEEEARRLAELDHLHVALAKAKAAHHYQGDYVVAPRGLVLSVTWVGDGGSSTRIDRICLHQASVELQVAGFRADEMPGFDWLPVTGLAEMPSPSVETDAAFRENYEREIDQAAE